MILVYSMLHCPQCDATIKTLEDNNIQYTKIDLSSNDALEKVRLMGYRSAPVVVVTEDNHWCGFRPDKIKQLKIA